MKLSVVYITAAVIVGILALTFVSAESNYAACSRTCSAEFRASMKLCQETYHACTDSCSRNQTCRRMCSTEKLTCYRDASTNQRQCRLACKSNSTLLCEGTYTQGSVFSRGCDRCVCGANGRSICKKTPFCNFESATVEQSACDAAGGYYAPICSGPYFDIVCSQSSYCICGGTNEYQCPSGTTCVTSFVNPDKRTATVPGFKTLLGVDLGSIGVCARDHLIPSCGNGVCDAGETVQSCMFDCRAQN